MFTDEDRKRLYAAMRNSQSYNYTQSEQGFTDALKDKGRAQKMYDKLTSVGEPEATKYKSFNEFWGAYGIEPTPQAQGQVQNQAEAQAKRDKAMGEQFVNDTANMILPEMDKQNEQYMQYRDKVTEANKPKPKPKTLQERVDARLQQWSGGETIDPNKPDYEVVNGETGAVEKMSGQEIIDMITLYEKAMMANEANPKKYTPNKEWKMVDYGNNPLWKRANKVAEESILKEHPEYLVDGKIDPTVLNQVSDQVYKQLNKNMDELAANYAKYAGTEDSFYEDYAKQTGLSLDEFKQVINDRVAFIQGKINRATKRVDMLSGAKDVTSADSQDKITKAINSYMANNDHAGLVKWFEENDDPEVKQYFKANENEIRYAHLIAANNAKKNFYMQGMHTGGKEGNFRFSIALDKKGEPVRMKDGVVVGRFVSDIYDGSERLGSWSEPHFFQDRNDSNLWHSRKNGKTYTTEQMKAMAVSPSQPMDEVVVRPETDADNKAVDWLNNKFGEKWHNADFTFKLNGKTYTPEEYIQEKRKKDIDSMQDSAIRKSAEDEMLAEYGANWRNVDIPVKVGNEIQYISGEQQCQLLQEDKHKKLILSMDADGMLNEQGFKDMDDLANQADLLEGKRAQEATAKNAKRYQDSYMSTPYVMGGGTHFYVPDEDEYNDPAKVRANAARLKKEKMAALEGRFQKIADENSLPVDYVRKIYERALNNNVDYKVEKTLADKWKHSEIGGFGNLVWSGSGTGSMFNWMLYQNQPESVKAMRQWADAEYEQNASSATKLAAFGLSLLVDAAMFKGFGIVSESALKGVGWAATKAGGYLFSKLPEGTLRTARAWCSKNMRLLFQNEQEAISHIISKGYTPAQAQSIYQSMCMETMKFGIEKGYIAGLGRHIGQSSLTLGQYGGWNSVFAGGNFFKGTKVGEDENGNPIYQGGFIKDLGTGAIFGGFHPTMARLTYGLSGVDKVIGWGAGLTAEGTMLTVMDKTREDIMKDGLLYNIAEGTMKAFVMRYNGKLMHPVKAVKDFVREFKEGMPSAQEKAGALYLDSNDMAILKHNGVDLDTLFDGVGETDTEKIANIIHDVVNNINIPLATRKKFEALTIGGVCYTDADEITVRKDETDYGDGRVRYVTYDVNDRPVSSRAFDPNDTDGINQYLTGFSQKVEIEQANAAVARAVVRDMLKGFYNDKGKYVSYDFTAEEILEYCATGKVTYEDNTGKRVTDKERTEDVRRALKVVTKRFENKFQNFDKSYIKAKEEGFGLKKDEVPRTLNDMLTSVSKNEEEDTSDDNLAYMTEVDGVLMDTGITHGDAKNMAADGNFHKVTLRATEESQGQETDVYITEGELVYDAEGNIDKNNSSETIFYRGADGKVHAASPEKFKSGSEVIQTIDEYAADKQQRQQLADQKAKIDKLISQQKELNDFMSLQKGEEPTAAAPLPFKLGGFDASTGTLKAGKPIAGTVDAETLAKEEQEGIAQTQQAIDNSSANRMVNTHEKKIYVDPDYSNDYLSYGEDGEKVKLKYLGTEEGEGGRLVYADYHGKQYYFEQGDPELHKMRTAVYTQRNAENIEAKKQAAQEEEGIEIKPYKSIFEDEPNTDEGQTTEEVEPNTAGANAAEAEKGNETAETGEQKDKESNTAEVVGDTGDVDIAAIQKGDEFKGTYDGKEGVFTIFGEKDGKFQIMFVENGRDMSEGIPVNATAEELGNMAVGVPRVKVAEPNTAGANLTERTGTEDAEIVNEGSTGAEGSDYVPDVGVSIEIPRDEKGKMQMHKAPVENTINYLVSEFSAEAASKYVTAQKEKAQKAYDKAEKKKRPELWDYDDPEEALKAQQKFDAENAKVTELKEKAEYWAKVEEALKEKFQGLTYNEKREKRIQEYEKKYDEDNDNSEMSFWMAHPDLYAASLLVQREGEGIDPDSVKSETGATNIREFGLSYKKGGKSITRIAEDAMENEIAKALFETDNDLRSAIIDALLKYGSIKKVREELAKINSKTERRKWAEEQVEYEEREYEAITGETLEDAVTREDLAIEDIIKKYAGVDFNKIDPQKNSTQGGTMTVQEANTKKAQLNLEYQNLLGQRDRLLGLGDTLYSPEEYKQALANADAVTRARVEALDKRLGMLEDAWKKLPYSEEAMTKEEEDSMKALIKEETRGLNKLMRKLGLNLSLDDMTDYGFTDEGHRGMMDSGKIHLNIEGINMWHGRTIRKILGHELTHIGDTYGQQAYKALRDLVVGTDVFKDWIEAQPMFKGCETLEECVQKMQEDREQAAQRTGDKSLSVSEEGAEQEILADFIGERVLGNEAIVEKIMEIIPDSRNVFRKMYDGISDWVEDRKIDARTKEAREKRLTEARSMADAYTTDLENIATKVKETLSEAQQNSFKINKNGSGSGNTGTKKANVYTWYEAIREPDGRMRTGRDRFVEAADKAVEEGRYTPQERDEIIRKMDKMAYFAQQTGVKQKYFGLWQAKEPEVGDDGIIHMSCVVKNAEYPMNIDFSIICKKKVAATALLDYVVREAGIDIKDLTPDNLRALNEIVKKKGYEMACDLCFVEAKRFNLPNWANSFVDLWNPLVQVAMDEGWQRGTQSTKEVDEFNWRGGSGVTSAPNDRPRTAEELAAMRKRLEDFVTDNKERFCTAVQPQYNLVKDENGNYVRDGRIFTKAHEDPFDNKSPWKKKWLRYDENTGSFVEIEQDESNPETLWEDWSKDSFLKVKGNYEYVSGKGVVYANKPIVTKMMDLICAEGSKGERARKSMNAADLVSNSGMDNLINGFHDLYSIVNMHGGVSKPKSQHGHSPYISAALTGAADVSFSKEKAFHTGGVRNQSFSDYEANMWFDYMQMYADMSAMGMPMQVYTKEPACARLFGATGAKINLSLLCQTEKRMENAARLIVSRKKPTQAQKVLLDYIYKNAGLRPKAGTSNEILEALNDKDVKEYLASGTAKTAVPEKMQEIVEKIQSGYDGEWELNYGDQTFPADEAYDIINDATYSGNVGTILVAVSEKMLKMALLDPNIKMVIPYHKSGIPQNVAKSSGVFTYEDFTAWQTDKDVSTGKPKESKVNFYDCIELVESAITGKEPKAIKAFEDKRNGAKYRANAEEALKELMATDKYTYNDIPKLAAKLFALNAWKNGVVARFPSIVFEAEEGKEIAKDKNGNIVGIKLDENGNPVFNKEFSDYYYKVVEDYNMIDKDGNFSKQDAVKFNIPDRIKATTPSGNYSINLVQNTKKENKGDEQPVWVERNGEMIQEKQKDLLDENGYMDLYDFLSAHTTRWNKEEGRLYGSNDLPEMGEQVQGLVKVQNDIFAAHPDKFENDGTLSKSKAKTVDEQRKRVSSTLTRWIRNNSLDLNNPESVQRAMDAIDIALEKKRDIDGFLSVDDVFKAYPQKKNSIIGAQGVERMDKADGGTRMKDLSVAEQMEQEGKNKYEIHEATGWERGKDGKWRYEIDDNVDSLLRFWKSHKTQKVDTIEDFGKSINGYALKEIFGEDADIFKAYPDLVDMKCKIVYDVSDTTNGYYDGNKIVVNLANAEKLFGENEIDFVGLAGTFIHEVQHAIQEREGFARGGNMLTVTKERLDAVNNEIKTLEPIYDEYKQLEYRSMDDDTGEAMRWFKVLMDYEKEHQGDIDRYEELKREQSDLEMRLVSGGLDRRNFDDYSAIAGEVEARNATERLMYDDYSRRTKTFEETEDTKRDKQIIVGSTDVSEMGSRTKRKQRIFKNAIDGDKLTDNKRVLYQAFTGEKYGNVNVTRKGGRSVKLVLKKGDENGVGVSHALYAHLADGTNTPTGYITPSELMLVDEVIRTGAETPVTNNRKEYSLTLADGSIMKVITRPTVANKELFINAYTNRTSPSTPAQKTLATKGGTASVDELSGRKGTTSLESEQSLDANNGSQLRDVNKSMSPMPNPKGKSPVEYAKELVQWKKDSEMVKSGKKASYITEREDTDYMNAVKRGDTKTADKMVKAAAKAAMPETKALDGNGVPLVVYHGTPWGGFTKFQKLSTDDGFYFVSTSRDYSYNYAHSRDVFYDPELGGTETNEFWNPEIKELFVDVKNPFDVGDIGDYMTDDVLSNICRNLSITEGEFKTYYASDYLSDRVNLDNNQVYEVINNDRFASLLKEKGYDGIVDTEDGKVCYGVLSPNQIKSADPVTYDDAGNVIPLSERFNEKNPDIRYHYTSTREDVEVKAPVSYEARIRKAKEKAQEALTLFATDGNSTQSQEAGRNAVAAFIRAGMDSKVMQKSALGKRELNKIMSLVKDAKNVRMLRKHLNDAEQVIAGAEIKYLLNGIENLMQLKKQGKNTRGVRIAKSVDDRTRKMFEYMRGKVAELQETQIQEQIDALNKEIRERRAAIQNTEDEAEIASLEAEIRNLQEEKKPLYEIRNEQRSDNMQEAAETWKERLKELSSRFLKPEYDEKGNRTNELTEAEYEELECLTILNSFNDGKLIETQRVTDERSGETQDCIKDVQANVKALQAENTRLWNDMFEASDADKDVIRQKIAANNAKIDANEIEITALKEQQIAKFRQAHEMMKALVEQGRNRLKDEMMAEDNRRRDICMNAYEDVKLGNDWKEGRDEKTLWTMLKDFSFISPLKSFDFMCQYVSNKGAGKGYLTRTMRRQLLEAQENFIVARDKDIAELNAACEEIFGKGMTFEKVSRKYTQQFEAFNKVAAKVTGKDPYDSGVHLLNMETGWKETETVKMDKGTALQYWMWWQNKDGNMKMRAMGYDEGSVGEIEAYIGEDLMKFGRFLFGFYDRMGDRMNDVHKMLYHTSMARVENYSPLKISDVAVTEKVDLNEGNNAFNKAMDKVNTSFMSRTVNNKALSTMRNAFDIVSEHVMANEETIAYARIRKDLSYLLSSPAFKNTLNANRTGLYKDFMDAAMVAARLNTETLNETTKAFNKLLGMAAGGAIAFRNWTGLKQIMSYPAFMAYSANPKFQAALMTRFFSILEAKPTVIMANVHWAQEHLPLFRERWNEGLSGNAELLRTIEAYGKESLARKWMTAYSKYGMFFNRFVDAMTCAAGARAIYDFEKPRIKKSLLNLGYSEEEADQMAEREALYKANEYNSTQQSSEKVFVSADQASQQFLNRAYGMFQNSNRGFSRQAFLGARDALRTMFSSDYRERMMNYYTEEEGMTRSEAKIRIARDFANAASKVMMNGFAIKWIWDKTQNIALGAVELAASPVLLGTVGGGMLGSSVGSKFGYEKAGGAAGAIGGGAIGGMLAGATVEAAFSAFLSMFDDEDEEVKTGIAYWLDQGNKAASFFSQGSVVGNAWHDLAWNGKYSSPFTLLYSNQIEQLQKANEKYGTFSVELAAEICRQMPSVFGMNIDTWTTMASGAINIADSLIREGEDKEMAIDIALMLNCPKSMRTKIAKSLASKYTPTKFAELMAKAQRISLSDDNSTWARFKRAFMGFKVDTNDQKFKEFIKDHIDLTMSEETDADWDDASQEMEKVYKYRAKSNSVTEADKERFRQMYPNVYSSSGKGVSYCAVKSASDKLDDILKFDLNLYDEKGYNKHVKYKGELRDMAVAIHSGEPRDFEGKKEMLQLLSESMEAMKTIVNKDFKDGNKEAHDKHIDKMMNVCRWFVSTYKGEKLDVATIREFHDGAVAKAKSIKSRKKKSENE